MQVAHIGDAFKDDITVEGGFAGIIVDIFVEAAIHPELMKVRRGRYWDFNYRISEAEGRIDAEFE
jgi:hypothetical protein